MCMVPDHQVFPTEGWAPLVKGIQESTASGGPTHHLAVYEVMDNAYFAVHGGWQVSTWASGILCGEGWQHNGMGLSAPGYAVTCMTSDRKTF